MDLETFHIPDTESYGASRSKLRPDAPHAQRSRFLAGEVALQAQNRGPNWSISIRSRRPPTGPRRPAAAALRALVCLLLVLAGVELGTVRVARASFEVKDTSWEGTSELLALARERLGLARVRVVATLDFSALSPKDGVLLLHPETEAEYAEVSAFLTAGGRVAVLDDYGVGDRLLSHYRIFRVQAPLQPAAQLQKNPSLAIALPAVQAVAGQEQNRHPAVANVDRVVTNHPTALTNPNLTPVLVIPALGEPDATLAVTGVIAGRGRLFAMADPSVLINSMLRYPGNRAFAQGLVEYLVEDDSWGTRGGTLYLLTNRFDQAGRFGRSDTLQGDLARTLRSLQDALARWHKEGIPATVAWGLASLLGVFGLWWISQNALKGFRSNTPRFASPLPLLAQGGLPGRAAVLSAPSTDRALTVAELDGLLKDELCARASLPFGSTPEAALTVLEGRGLTPAVAARVKELLTAARRAEGPILRRQPSRITAGQVTDHERKLNLVLAELERTSKA